MSGIGPRPLDAVGSLGGLRCIAGDQWIEKRAKAVPWLPDVTWEAVWWAEALGRLHEGLWVNALTPGSVIARTIRYDEGDRTVTLYVETWGRGVADAEWGLPMEVRQTLAGLAPCPSGGDVLVLPGGGA